MSTRTPNYSLILPAQEDYYNVDDFNDNYTAIDEELKNNADGLDAAADKIDTHMADKQNPHSVTAEQLGLGSAAEDIKALKAAMPRGTKFITINKDTPFTTGWGSGLSVLGSEIYVCQGRIVRVDIESGMIAAKECGLCMNGNSLIRLNSVVVFVKKKPEQEISLAVTDLGRCIDRDGKPLTGVVINGLISAGLDMSDLIAQ